MRSESNTENVTKIEILELATWNRPRSERELGDFITTRVAAIADSYE